MRIFKRLISVLLVLSVFACITPVSAGVKGDMNGDGKLLISDARVVLKNCRRAKDTHSITKKFRRYGR